MGRKYKVGTSPHQTLTQQKSILSYLKFMVALILPMVHIFLPNYKLWQQQDILSFYNNYRGSLSYGENFALLLQYKYSSIEDFADHMSGIDTLIDLGFIDDKNLFIAGGSAGGIATAYAIGLTDRFNAAVAAKPVINWLSKPLTADSMVGQIYHQFPGPPMGKS